MEFTLRGARLVDAVSDLPQVDLIVGDRQIRAIQPSASDADTAPPPQEGPPTAAQIDASGMILMPGFVEVHTHGGGGYNLHTSDPMEIRAYARWVVSTGVTSFLVGVVGNPGGLPEEQLRAAAGACAEGERDPSAAEALGIHLEGPYISEHRRGAHLASWLRVPNSAETERLLELAGGRLRIITLAPELDGASALIRRMVEAQVTVSIGHTDATYDQAREAILLGATHMTHCCNAMRPLHHRDPGPLCAVAEADEVYGELIADGIHVHPAMMRLIAKLLGPERTIVITDALAGAGVPDGTFEFNGQRATVVDGVARLDDGTITGSVLTMDQALRNVVQWTGISLTDAVGMLTRNPARAAGTAGHKGRLAAGYDADLLLFDPDLTLQATIRGGVLVYATDAWRERLSGIPSALPEPVVALPAAGEVAGLGPSGAGDGD
jgi:N-acetylglucosamine-6-phosphate deacetylase